MRGRKPSGPRLVDGKRASRHAKLRLRTILETISGEKTIEEACGALGIGEAAFHKLRSRLLDDALGSLEPRQPGRPPRERDPASERVEALEEEVRSLRKELRASRVREELALTMPHLLRGGAKKKKRR